MSDHDENVKGVRRIFDSILYKDPIKALTGTLNADGTLNLDPTFQLEGGYIWVRPITALTRGGVPALNGINDAVAGAPCVLGYNGGGELVAFDADLSSKNVQTYAEHLAPMRTPQQTGSTVNAPVPALLVTGGRVQPSTPNALTVFMEAYVPAGFLYGLDVDVSADIPASAHQHLWELLYLDSSGAPQTQALTAHTFSTNAGLSLMEAVSAALALAAGSYPLAAVSLSNGETAINLSTSRFQDLRGLIAQIPSAGSSPLTTKGDLFTFDTADARLPVGTDGYLLSANSAQSTGLEWIAPSGGAALSVTDGMTTVIDVDAINFVGASVTDLGGGVAEVTITGGGSGVNKDRFTQTANATVANTTTPTTLLGSGQGSTSFDIDAVGRTVEGELWGVISTLGVLPGNLTIEVSIGGTTVLSTGAISLITSLSNVLWNLRYRITVVTTGGSGTVIAEGKFSITNTLADSVEMLSNGTSTVTVDTTGTPVEDVQAMFSAASTSNSITTTNADLRFIDPNVGSGGGGGGSVSVAIYEEQQPSGTNGGISSSGVQTRVLNTEVSDINNIATLSSNQITISNAGTYLIEFEAQCFGGDQHQAILYDITNSAEIKRGRSLYAVSVYVSENTSSGRCVLVLTASRTLELRHFITTARVLDGLGTAVSNGTEVYSRVTITQLT